MSDFTYPLPDPKLNSYPLLSQDQLLQGDITLSEAFLHSKDCLLVVDHPEIFTTEFSYKRYCQKQNEWMRQYKKVYRFIEGDPQIDRFRASNIRDESSPYVLSHFIDREHVLPDPSPLEYFFENCFIEAFGADAIKYLKREYAFLAEDGSTTYVDYALFKKDGTWIAIEENGISYHHPLIIKSKKYRQILKKQNSIISANGIVYRWDTESLSTREKTIDELKEFIGDLNDYLVQSALLNSRGFALHEHQSEYLESLKQDRASGKKSALVVLPTGTGKTVIALEDMKQLADRNMLTNSLVLVPTIDLVRQWEKAASSYQSKKLNIEVMTYAGISRKYLEDPYDAYQYLIVDEAHHAAAPVLRKVIQFYRPEFVLGLTATDQRLDARQLEDIFGQYEEKLDLKQAIEKDLLCQIRAFRLESSLDLSEVRFNGQDYVASDLERRIRVNSRNELIADVLHEYFCSRLPGKSGLVFCVNIAHAKEMARLLQKRGFKAESVDGSDPKRKQKIDAYMEGSLQFLCTCSLLNEGWDAPRTSVIVMARPTLSKVLYTQQLGRGTRKYPGKEALYVIDVVDRYGSFGSISNRPWSVHALLGLEYYKSFSDLIPKPGTASEELIALDSTHEKLIKLEPFELFTMQKLYEDYLSPESLARELFVSTGTVNSWILKGQLVPDQSIPMGRSTIRLFRPDRVDEIRESKGLKVHTEETLLEDFWSFIEERSYSFSYKMFFILSLLKTADSAGESDITKLMEAYRAYYLERHDQGKTVDRANTPYHEKDFILDDHSLIQNILSNPFEKFERKRFMYYAKDLKKISIHHRIWDDLTRNNGIQRLENQMLEDLKNYYEPLGGY